MCSQLASACALTEQDLSVALMGSGLIAFCPDAPAQWQTLEAFLLASNVVAATRTQQALGIELSRSPAIQEVPPGAWHLYAILQCFLGDFDDSRRWLNYGFRVCKTGPFGVFWKLKTLIIGAVLEHLKSGRSMPHRVLQKVWEICGHPDLNAQARAEIQCHAGVAFLFCSANLNDSLEIDVIGRLKQMARKLPEHSPLRFTIQGLSPGESEMQKRMASAAWN